MAGTAEVLDVASGDLLGRPMRNRGIYVMAVAIGPDARKVVKGTGSRSASLWDARRGSATHILEHRSAVSAVAMSPDGKTVVTGSLDETARLWNADTGEALGQPLKHGDQVLAVAFSPDGKTVLTGCRDRKARLWDPATGKPIGRPMEHPYRVSLLAFSPDGETIFTADSDSERRWTDPDELPEYRASTHTARLWNRPAELPNDLPRLAAWVATMTGLEIDGQGSMRVLDDATWRRKRERLNQLGGVPPDRHERLLDPVLFGSDPTARARSWMERQQWVAAEAEFDEAVRARPLNSKVWDDRGRLRLARSMPERAAQTSARPFPTCPTARISSISRSGPAIN